MTIGGVLFDKDGTLFDYHATWSAALQELALQCAGDAARAQRLLEAGGWDAAQRRFRAGSVLAAGDTGDLARLWAPMLGADAGELLARLDAAFESAPVARAVPAADLPPLLDGLTRRGLALGVATHDSHSAARKLLHRFGLEDRFAFVCGYDCGHAPKPDAAMALAFCAAAGLPPQRVVVVGDNPCDLLMARAAGAGAALGVLTGTGSRAELGVLADAVLPSVAALPAWLDARAWRESAGA